MNEAPYGNLLGELAERIDAALDKVRAEHNFESGGEVEAALCESLETFLPERTAVARGYIVAEDGTTEGDDIIVYERSRFPSIRGTQRDYLRKERIPADAVLAYIEVKSKLYLGRETGKNRGQHLRKALEQIAKIKRLKRRVVPLSQILPRLILDGFDRRPGMPNIRNPWYCAIWAPATDMDDLSLADVTKTICALQRELNILPRHLPDVIAAGDLFACPTIEIGQLPDHPPEDRRPLARPFLARDTRLTLARADHAIGVACLHLHDALDDLVLAGIQWRGLISNSLAKSNSDPLSAVVFDAQEHLQFDYPLPDGVESPPTTSRPDPEVPNAPMSEDLEPEAG